MSKQKVYERPDGTRYVMGTEEIQGKEIPCEMDIIHRCGKCGFEWPDVLTVDEVKVIDHECPECR